MHIGIVGPCSSGPLADFLPESAGVDLGCGGYPIVNLVRAMIGQGHYVSVITLSPAITDRRILKGPQLTYYVYPMRTQRRMRDLYKAERHGLREGILLAKPDILHAHWTYEYGLACLETGLPMLVTCHDNAFRVLRFSRGLYVVLHRLGRVYLQIRVIRKTRFLTAVSPYMADTLRWLAKTDLEVIPNPIEVPSEYGNECDGESGSVRIATVLNGWQYLKNPKPAIIAFNLLRRELPSVEMFMYGNGFEKEGPASKWATSKGLIENIHFCGPLPHHELQTELSKMSILLHPSLEEACPMAVIEGMALGLPVVGGSNSGGLPWVLDEGRAGFLTDVRDPEKIAQTLLRCIEQEQDREQRQNNAYHRVLSLFSPNSVARQYEEIYEKVLSSYRSVSNQVSSHIQSKLIVN